MPHKCVAYGCNSNSDIDRDVSFHRFPLDQESAKRWERAIRRKNWRSSKHSKLCSRHFKQQDYQVRPGAEKPMLKKSAVPSIFIFSKQLEKNSEKKHRFITLLNKIVDLTAAKINERRNLAADALLMLSSCSEVKVCEKGMNAVEKRGENVAIRAKEESSREKLQRRQQFAASLLNKMVDMTDKSNRKESENLAVEALLMLNEECTAGTNRLEIVEASGSIPTAEHEACSSIQSYLPAVQQEETYEFQSHLQPAEQEESSVLQSLIPNAEHVASFQLQSHLLPAEQEKRSDLQNHRPATEHETSSKLQIYLLPAVQEKSSELQSHLLPAEQWKSSELQTHIPASEHQASSELQSHLLPAEQWKSSELQTHIPASEHQASSELQSHLLPAEQWKSSELQTHIPASEHQASSELQSHLPEWQETVKSHVEDLKEQLSEMKMLLMSCYSEILRLSEKHCSTS